tara:strand:+ start:1017 stop:1457 length:441 start_codon:yes stop_codon:yes gene_type:complete
MNTSEFFKQLGLTDPELNDARELVSYKKFEEVIPDVLLLSEFVDTVFREAIAGDDKSHIWFSQKYMISKYFTTDIIADDAYVSLMLGKIKLAQTTIETSDEFSHIHRFFTVLIDYLITQQKVLSKGVLNYLNILYKTKGRVANYEN